MPHAEVVATVPARPAYHHGNLREALLGAGLELTRSGGARALGLRDVTRRVGVSPSAAYRHFADRESLLAAVRVRIQHGVAERMRQHEGSDSSAPPRAREARSRLAAVGLGYIAFALEEPGWFDVAFSGADALPQSAPSESIPAPLASLSAALDALVDAGELDADARAGAEWPCWSAVHGFALLALHGPLRHLSSDEVWAAARRTVDTIVAGLLTVR